MENKKFDLVVIGGGPGGYVAAIRASQLKMKVAVIEESNLGGICLNWGCIPTKALLKSGEVKQLLDHVEDYGFNKVDASFDFAKIIARSRSVSSKLSQGIGHLMKKHKVTLFNARGKLNGNNKVRVFTETPFDIDAKNIIIATGAKARTLPDLQPDGKFIWSYKEAMVPEKQPKSVLVVGSGAIGVEYANFYNALGSKVTILELADRILPVEDKEISQLAYKAFTNQGINIALNSTIKKIAKGKNDVTIDIINQSNNKIEKVTVEKIISAVGIVANTQDIGLEGTKIKLEKQHIIINEFCQTEEKNIYAIGDVVGAPWLAHKASHEAIVAVEKMAGLNAHPIKVENIPGCTYSNPQIASIGLSEEKAKEQGLAIKIGRFPFMANGKAIAIGKDSGLIKLIFAKDSGEILGAHMIGSDVTEMIQSLALAKSFEATEEDIIRTIFPHPTLSEMIHEAALDAEDRAIHI
jgi:dihydrolipoamide dehydrogenase